MDNERAKAALQQADAGVATQEPDIDPFEELNEPANPHQQREDAADPTEGDGGTPPDPDAEQAEVGQNIADGKQAADPNKLHGKALESALGIKRQGGEDDATFLDRLAKEIDAVSLEEHRATYEVGKRLVVVEQEGLYQEDTFAEFIASHRVKGWGRSKVAAVMGQVRDFILGGVARVEQGQLERIGWRKVEEVRGPIAKGAVTARVAFREAEALSARDLAKKRQEWLVAHAKAKGIQATIAKSCETCTKMCEWKPSTDQRELMLARVFTSEKSQVVSEQQTLRVDSICFCKQTGNVLSVNKKPTKAQSSDRARHCGWYEEQF